MKKNICVLLVVSISLVFSKPPKIFDNWIENNKTLTGKWTWIQTECCGKKTGITTPSIYGDNILLEIFADNTFKESSSNKHKIQRMGNVQITKVSNDDKIMNILQFNDERPAYYRLSQNGDTLILSWEHLELQKETYIRSK